MRRSPVAYSIDKYRALTPNPSTQGLRTAVMRPAEPQHVRDRSSSPTANARFVPAPLVPPFALQGRVPVRQQVRSMTPDSRELLKRAAPLPVPVTATSNSNRMLREQNITTRSNGSERRPEPLSVRMVSVPGATKGTNPAMVDTRSRTMARSVSPMVAVPLEQYYSRSRPGTPFRSLSPSGHSSTPTHDPRAPSPCRIFATKANGRQPQMMRPQQIITRQPSAEGAKQFVTYRQPPGVVLQGISGGRVSVAQAAVRVRQPSPIQGSQSNTSTIASMQAMSVYSGSQASPPIPGGDCAPRPLAPGASYLPYAPAGVGTSPSGAPLPPNAELCEGAVLPIITGGGTCRIKKPLGMGSFGAVWEAEQTGGGPALALKEILCHSHVDLVNAQFEGSLLESFKGKEPGKMDSASILPVLVGSDMSPLSDNLYRVRLAMTRLPGQPLDTFLRIRQEEQLPDQRSAASRIETMNEAFHFAWELLQQLAPAFEEHLAALAYHRDVNAHNILIDFANSPNPKYGLVDFGLAVDVQSWQGELEVQERAQPSRQTRVGQDGATTWHHLDVGGDCRYWPVSAWVQFLLGWTELECNPMLRSEYRTRLDMHSLGLTALQVLVETMPPDLSLPPGHSAGGLFAELQSLKSGWERYWAMVTPLHSRLMETFHNGGDWDVLKAHCLDNNVHEAIAAELRGIRGAIIRAHAAGRSLPSNSGFCSETAAGLHTALLLLIGCGDRSHEVEGTVGPGAEEVPGPNVWRQVRMSLSDKDGMSPSSPGKPRNVIGRGNERRADVRLSPASAPNRSAGLTGTDATSPSGQKKAPHQSNGDAVKRTLGAGDIPTQTMLEKVDWMIANELPR